MRRKALYLLISLLAITAVLLTGCNVQLTSLNGSPAQSVSSGKLEVRITDAPPDAKITAVQITVESVEVHTAGSSNDVINTASSSNLNPTPEQEQGNGKGKGNANKIQNQEQVQTSPIASAESDENGWKPLEMASANMTINLLDLQGVSASLAAGDFSSGIYTQIRLDVSKVMVSYQDGDVVKTEEAKLPSGKLKILHPFEIGPNQITTLLLDFDALKSINITGNGQIMCKPVIKVSGDKPSGKSNENKANDNTPKTETNGMIITPTTLPNGKVGQAYVADLNVTGGTGPYTWSIANGLPAGLNVDPATGTITGQPLVANTYHFTVKVSDSSKVSDITKAYTLVVDP